MLIDLSHMKRDLESSTNQFIPLTLILILTIIIILEIHGGIDRGDMHTLLGTIATVAGDIMVTTTTMITTMISGLMLDIIIGTIGIMVGMVIIMDTIIHKIIGFGTEDITMAVVAIATITMEKEVITTVPKMDTTLVLDLVVHTKEQMEDPSNKQAV